MPLYSYYCKTCDEVIEKMASISLRDEQSCVKCDTDLQRKIDSPGMVWSPTRNGGYSR